MVRCWPRCARFAPLGGHGGGFYGCGWVWARPWPACSTNRFFAVVTRRFPLHFRRGIITMTFLGGLASTVFIPAGDWLIRHLGWRKPRRCWLACICCCARRYMRGCCEGQHPMGPMICSARRRPRRPQPGARTVAFDPIAGVSAFLLLMTVATASLPVHMISCCASSTGWRSNGGGGASTDWRVPGAGALAAVLLRTPHGHTRRQPGDSGLDSIGIGGTVNVTLAGAMPTRQWWCCSLCCLASGNGMLTIVKGTAMAEYVSVQHVAVLNGLLGLLLALVRVVVAPLALGWAWSLSGGYGGALAVVVCLTWWGYGRWCRRSAAGAPIIGLFGRHAQPRTFSLPTPPRRPIPREPVGLADHSTPVSLPLGLQRAVILAIALMVAAKLANGRAAVAQTTGGCHDSGARGRSHGRAGSAGDLLPGLRPVATVDHLVH